MPPITPETPCPCSSGRPFADCCAAYLSGVIAAPTAEALMRSRYAAFATHNVPYLEETLLPETRHDFDKASTEHWAKTCEWTGLEIKDVEEGTEADEEGVIEFVARYRQEGQDLEHHEVSHFVRREGKWYYDAGSLQPLRVSKAGRNAPCPCGSGKKYKKCCGA
jgi:SEC-C motif-containing protein